MDNKDIEKYLKKIEFYERDCLKIIGDILLSIRSDWSDDESDLYKKLYSVARQKANKYDYLAVLTNCTNISANIKEKIALAFINGFYATMYGGKPHLRGQDGYDTTNQIFFHSGDSGVEIWEDGSLCYVWGWPGPDYTVWYPKEYGISWFLTKEEFDQKYLLEDK